MFVGQSVLIIASKTENGPLVILYVWETSIADQDATHFATNYKVLNTVASEDTTSQSLQNQTIELNFMTEEDGCYFSTREETSCIVLTCIIIYHVCPEEVSDLVVHPETIAPPIVQQDQLVEIITKCVPGATPENSVVRLGCAQRYKVLIGPWGH